RHGAPRIVAERRTRLRSRRSDAPTTSDDDEPPAAPTHRPLRPAWQTIGRASSFRPPAVGARPVSPADGAPYPPRRTVGAAGGPRRRGGAPSAGGRARATLPAHGAAPAAAPGRLQPLLRRRPPSTARAAAHRDRRRDAQAARRQHAQLGRSF